MKADRNPSFVADPSIQPRDFAINPNISHSVYTANVRDPEISSCCVSPHSPGFYRKLASEAVVPLLSLTGGFEILPPALARQLP
ncbi:MAG: hypothetical protein GY826_35010 [Fuerstiella sp.]|nr:hypothetical protein [Fuerstiella sp.]